MAVICLVALAAALPARGAPTNVPPGWARIAPAVRAALAPTLSPSEIRRLLRSRTVREALVHALAGYDGKDDSIRVAVEHGVLTMHVVIRRRARRCIRLGGAPETGRAQRSCREVPIDVARTRVTLPAALWRPPPPGERKTPEKPPLPTVLREQLRPPRPPRAVRDLDQLISADEHWVHEVTHTPRLTDPFRPANVPALEAARSWDLARLTGARPATPEPTRAMQNLSDPYGPGRLQTDWPVPNPSAWVAAHQPLETVPEPDAACRRAFELGPATPEPPALACYEAVVRHAIIDHSGVYTAGKWLQVFAPLAWTGQVMMEHELEAANREGASAIAWISAWLGWIERGTGRLDQALVGLTTIERDALRHWLWRLWADPNARVHRTLIVRIFRTRLGALYPAALGPNGLPIRDRLPTALIWATNWLAAANHLDPDRIQAAFASLPTGQQATLRTALTSLTIAKAAPKAASVIAPSR